uniref:Cation/H+ exchanger transmembrane domain-containing protein n=1 Tax=Phaeomonas parva TaxID=124430 RepID=A0A7S1U3P5_9STRA|mmetsp:Transcript_30006/g.95889  ORF Transcript_30006/g.95889 Transcript_30006/m.95889 type:complete len:698 (+) Transcript_30006:118-2211(+)
MAHWQDCFELVQRESDEDPEEIFGRTDETFCSDIYDFYDDYCVDDEEAREGACCSEAKDLYLDRCDEEEDALREDAAFCIVMMILICCFLARSLLSSYGVTWIPEAGASVLVGAAAGGILKATDVHDLAFSDTVFMRILLPPIILSATVALDKRAFRNNFGIVMAFAVFGTLVASFVTGFITYSLAQLIDECEVTLVESLLFGTAISSVDPIAALVIFRSLGVPPSSPMYVALFGESVLNDGVVFMLFHLFLAFLDGENSNAGEVAGTIGFFVLGMLGSIVVGLAIPAFAGVLFTKLRGRFGPIMESSLLVVVALLPYYLCNALGWSGVVAIVASGLMVEPYVLKTVQRRSRRIFKTVLEFLTVAFETFVFAYVGVFMVLEEYDFCPTLVCIAILACVASRAMHVFPSTWVLNKYNTGKNLRRQQSLADMQAALGPGQPSPGGRNPLAPPEESSKTEAVSAMQVTRGSISEEPLHGRRDSDDHDDAEGPGFFGMVEAARNLGVREAFENRALLQDEAPLYDWKDQLLMWFVAMRGAVAFALIEAIPDYDIVKDEGSEGKSTLVFLTAIIIIVSIFVVGSAMVPLMKFLGVDKAAQEADEPETFGSGLTLPAPLPAQRETSAEDYTGTLNEPFLIRGYEHRFGTGEIFMDRYTEDGVASPIGESDRDTPPPEDGYSPPGAGGMNLGGLGFGFMGARRG